MTTQTAEYRVLDERLNGHARRLEILEQNHKSLSEDLSQIKRDLVQTKRVLFQIKWIGVGMILMLLIQEFGIAEVLRKLL